MKWADDKCKSAHVVSISLIRSRQLFLILGHFLNTLACSGSHDKRPIHSLGWQHNNYIYRSAVRELENMTLQAASRPWAVLCSPLRYLMSLQLSPLWAFKNRWQHMLWWLNLLMFWQEEEASSTKYDWGLPHITASYGRLRIWLCTLMKPSFLFLFIMYPYFSNNNLQSLAKVEDLL